MRQYIARRVLIAIPTLLGVLLLVFASLHLTPVDPARMMLTEHRAGTAPVTGEGVSEEEIQRMRERMGLNRPLTVQFLDYAWGAVRGDLGTSWREHRTVTSMIMRNAPSTIELSVTALIISSVLGVLLGVVSGVREKTWFDTTAMTGSVIGVSMPSFWLGLMLMLLFAYRLRWFPAFGAGGFRYVVLPAFTMGLGGAALIARMVRSSLVEVLRQDYIRTARAKGVSERVINYRHALRNAMIPTATVIGLSVGRLLAGSVIIENVFGRPGLGRMAVDAIWENDFPVVQGTVLVLAVGVVTANLLVDLTYGILDPRIRYD